MYVFTKSKCWSLCDGDPEKYDFHLLNGQPERENTVPQVTKEVYG